MTVTDEDRKAAADAYREETQNGFWSEREQAIRDGNDYWCVQAFAAHRQAAYAAGLERAAVIAEERQSNDEDWDTSYWNQCAVNIAAAIRAEKDKT